MLLIRVFILTSASLPRLLRIPRTSTTGIVSHNDQHDLEFFHASPTSAVGWRLSLAKNQALRARAPAGLGQKVEIWEADRGAFRRVRGTDFLGRNLFGQP